MKGLTEQEIETACEAGFVELWKSESFRKYTTERPARETYRLAFYAGGEVASQRAADILDECHSRLCVAWQSTAWNSETRRGFENACHIIEDAFGVPRRERIA